MNLSENTCPKPRICAHAGCEGFPMDGLEAIEAGIRAGAHFVELDLRFTAEGQAVLSHNPLGTRSPGSLVTLDQALDLLAHHPAVGINIDLKEPRSLGIYPTRITGPGVPNPVYFTGLKPRQIRAFRRACPGLAHTLDVLPWWFSLVPLGTRVAHLTGHRNAGGQALNLSWTLVDRALVEAGRLAGLPVRVWTVDDPVVMARMAALGVEVITTNRVSDLAGLLG